ncbi:MAG TPA: hypothetical protein VFE97_20445 [Methylomirabilota bacterium]|nr:hypothetical protein [Methylomirabilota bacterium]
MISPPLFLNFGFLAKALPDLGRLLDGAVLGAVREAISGPSN